jgi:hypothetical protein
MGQYHKTGHDHFVPYRSQFITHNHPVIRSHVTQDTASCTLDLYLTARMSSVKMLAWRGLNEDE